MRQVRHAAYAMWHAVCGIVIAFLVCAHSTYLPFALHKPLFGATQIGTKYTCDPFFPHPSVFRLVRLKESTNGRTEELTQAGTEEVAREFQETDDGTRIGTRI